MMPESRIPGLLLPMGLVILFAFGSGNIRGESAETPPPKPLLILFSDGKVEFSGTIPSQAAASALARAALRAQPRLRVVNAGLVHESSLALPDMPLLQSLLTEIGLSTHHGYLQISDDRLLIGGLTDSVVTSSVLRLRVQPILGGRRYTDRICVIPTEDLPALPILLSNGESRQEPSFQFQNKERETVDFEPPGFLLGKLLGLIEGTGTLTWEAPEGPPPPPLEMEDVGDLTLAAPPEAEEAEERAADVTPSPPPPPDPYLELGTIAFGRHSFLLRAGEREKLTALSRQLNAPSREMEPVTVQSAQYRSGAAAFDHWLCQRRLVEVFKFLEESGVDPGRLQPETTASGEILDTGVVRILLKKPETESADPLPAPR